MKKVGMLLALGAVGYTGFAMYKKFNPDYKKDLKKNMDKMVKKVNKISENMM